MGRHDSPAFNKWTEQQENSPDCRWNQQKLKVAACCGFLHICCMSVLLCVQRRCYPCVYQHVYTDVISHHVYLNVCARVLRPCRYQWSFSRPLAMPVFLFIEMRVWAQGLNYRLMREGRERCRRGEGKRESKRENQHLSLNHVRKEPQHLI